MMNNGVSGRSKRYPCSRLIILLGVLCVQVANAEVTTVILSNHKDATFQVTWTESKKSQDLEFPLDLALPDALKNAQVTVTQCELYVVEDRPKGKIKGQDVAVLNGAEQIGELHLGDQDTGSFYRTLLQPTSCHPNKKTLKMTLQAMTLNSDRLYYGGAASIAGNRPRLIVTYNSPNPQRSGDSTDWTYEQPTGYFAAPLWQGEMLANPVSYDGAVYVVAACASPNNGRCLYRVAGARNVRNWPLGFQVTAHSFAFVTAWGRLQIITENGIRSCDLTTLNRSPSEACTPGDNEQITVNAGETPVMGPDGSLYFKNVDVGGSIVARNPKLQEIWRTMLKFTTVSPIALSANGRNAYALADIPIQETTPKSIIALLRIDTATGETVMHEIFHCGSKPVPCTENDKVKPALKTLLRPAVAGKAIKVQGKEATVDYVFVAGNTSDTSVLQAIMFEPCVPSSKPCPPPSMLWNQTGTVSGAPVLSVDGNSLFVVQGQDGVVKRYNWYNTTPESTGAVVNPVVQDVMRLPKVMPVFVDGSKSVYPCPKSNHCDFMVDGALIGYSDNAIYDLSPKYVPSPKGATDVWPSSLKTGMIYSADRVTAPATPGVKAGDRVILKGQRIGLPNTFRWPIGATLKVQGVGPASQ